MIPGYRDFGLVARGGFSEVYTAHQEAFDRTVAVKVITIAMSDATLRRYRRELATVGRLDGHPHVVRVYESGFTDEGHPYLTMEYHPAGSLADRLHRDGPLPVADVLDIGVKLASALASAHDRGVLHRDIKPQNVLQSAFHGPVLADFGIAAFDGGRERTLTGEAFSALHVAPEVLDGHPPTKAADLYSLASTLYELLAGVAPFAAGDEDADDGLLALMRRVRTQAVPALDREDVPAAFAAELGRLLARDPHERPGSAQELARRLRDVQTALGLTPTPLAPASAGTVPPRPSPGEPGPTPAPAIATTPPLPPPPDHGARRGRRWRLPAAGAAAVLLVSVAVVWAGGGDEDDPVADGDGSSATSTTEVPATTVADSPTTAAPPPSSGTPAPAAALPAPADGKDDRIHIEADGTPAYYANVAGHSNGWGSRQVIGEGWHPERTLFADLDGDGKDDRVYVGIDGAGTYFANLDGANGNWGPPRTIGQGWDPARVQFADLEGDGKDDWLYLGEDAVLRYHENIDGPAGSWGPGQRVSFGWDPSRLEFADLDGDGKDDQVSIWGDGKASWWVNIDLPNLQQGPEQPLGTGWDPARIQFADLDGDGRDDLVQVGADGVTRFHANADGTGSWGPAVELGTGWDPARLKFADLG